MVRSAIFMSFVLCAVTATPVWASDVPMPRAVSATPTSIDAARLLAHEIATRAQGGGLANGRFTPSVPRPAVIATPSAQPTPPACGDVKGLAADTVDENGLRFMPLHRDSTHPYKMPARGEAIARAQALQAAIAGGKGESELAQTALQTDAQADPRVQAETELAKITGNVPPAANPNALAKEAVLREIQKYRAARGKF
jgi:hypothetical protein